METYTLTTNATVNADVNGSVYNYTYTAVADTAGNLGESISRIITIIDALPIDVTSLSITSSPGNPNFAKADDTITLVLRTDSNDLSSITGTLLGREFTSTINGGSATFTTTGYKRRYIFNLQTSDGRVANPESERTRVIVSLPGEQLLHQCIYYCYDSAYTFSEISCSICNCSICIVVDRAIYVGIYCGVCG